MDATATERDAGHMGRALELAERGRGRVSPNPLVGAVLVSGDEVIGEGFHAELGGLHAETAAIADCRDRGHDPAGATLYVTLEPCAHQGRQPPCADAILAAGISRVVIGCDDPSDKASGRGPGALRDGGVDVDFATGSEAAAARLLVQDFRKRARTGRPLVCFKAALSLDGRMATASGDSRWISSAESRELVHRWRAEVDAVAIGIGTALADDPLLTARDVQALRQPARVVFDSQARLPLGSKLVESIDEARLILVIGPNAPADRVGALEVAGAEIVVATGTTAPDRVLAALAELGRRDIQSVMVEGGPTLADALLSADEVDELRLFIAPLLIGAGGLGLTWGDGAKRIESARRPLSLESRQVGTDILLHARLKEW